MFDIKEKKIQRTIEYSEFSERMRNARVEAGLDRREVGTILGKCKPYIHRMETENVVPKLETFVELCKIYKTTPNKILGFE